MPYNMDKYLKRVQCAWWGTPQNILGYVIQNFFLDNKDKRSNMKQIFSHDLEYKIVALKHEYNFCQILFFLEIPYFLFTLFSHGQPFLLSGGIIYPPTKGGLEVCVFIFSFTFLDATLVTKTMCTQNLVHILLYGGSHSSGDVWLLSF